MSGVTLLFLSSFLAATILPTQSELVLVALMYQGDYSKAVLLTVATVGNVLGSVVNWVLGYYLLRFKDRKWFPLKENKMQAYSHMYRKWGMWSLLLAWVPIIGDPLTVMAGIFRTNIFLFILLVTIGKAGRYVCVVMFF